MCGRLVAVALLFGAIVVSSVADATFGVVERTYVAHDTTRDGHRVVATLYLAQHGGKGALDPAPVAAFGHGFGLGPKLYPLARELTVRRGMTVFLPTDWGMVPSTLNLARDQAFLLQHAVEQSMSNASSPFFGRVLNRTVLMGHSLGGGSTVLAADPNLTGMYAAPNAIATASLGTYTIPDSMKSAPRILSRIPALLLTATQDCVDPPEKNSIPVFSVLPTQCAFVVSVVGGSHCQYANYSLGCEATEFLCGARPNITREQQVHVALRILLPFLDASLGPSAEGALSAPWKDFHDALASAVAGREVELLASRSSSCIGLSLDVHSPRPTGSDALDQGFAPKCQRTVALSSSSQMELGISELRLEEGGFLRTKPSLSVNSLYDNITIVTHLEGQEIAAAHPFPRVLALKMKSRAAVTASREKDNVTCADLHEISLELGLNGLEAEERLAYGVRTKALRFGADELWRTGLWVSSARLRVKESSDGREVIVIAPRFSSTVGLPFDLGGMMYCRVLPPSAIRDWVRSQLNDTRPDIAAESTVWV